MIDDECEVNSLKGHVKYGFETDHFGQNMSLV